MRLLWRMGNWSRRLLLLLLLLLLRRQLWRILLRLGHIVRHGCDDVGVGERKDSAAVAAAQLRL
jgi:hypothetical protein